MSRRSQKPSSAAHPVVVAFQIFLVLATLLAPIPVMAEDPSAPPSEPAATELAATPDPTADPTADPTEQPTAAPTVEPRLRRRMSPLPRRPRRPLGPHDEPTSAPTAAPSAEPNSEPTTAPTTAPEPVLTDPDRSSRPLRSQPRRSRATSRITRLVASSRLTGSNWQPGESVHIFVNDDFGSSWSRNVDVTADASGNITDQFNLPNWFVAAYSVVATGPSGTASTRFTDASLRILRAPTGSPPNLAFTITAAGFTNSSCSTTSSQSGTDSAVINSDAGSTDINLSNNAGNAFVRLTAPASPTSPSTGWTFKEWSSAAGSENVIATTSSTSICVRNPGGSQNDIYVATYRETTIATTTSASNTSVVYGATSASLSATVTPASGPSVNSGTVTFTVKKGTVTIGSAVTSTTVSAGSATASFSLAGINADTYVVEAVYNTGSGFGSSNNFGQSPAPTLTVSKASLVVTPDAKSRTYGQAAPTYTFGVTGFQNSETAATAAGYVAPTCTSDYTATTPVSASPRTISCSGGSANNYTFNTTATAQLTISSKSLTITAS